MPSNKEIRQKRLHLKLSQEDISFATQIDQSHYSKIERGIIKPTESQLKSILKFLKLKK